MSANRFKKSIESATDNTQGNIAENAMCNVTDSTANNDDILKKVLENTKKDKGGNHTVYLSADVGRALGKLAEQSKKSKSALIDEILREVLLGRHDKR